MAYPVYNDTSATTDSSRGWLANLKNLLGDTSSEFKKQPTALLASGADDEYLDPGLQRDLLMAQAAERKKNALRSVQGLTQGVQGSYQGTPRYQHYVADYGAPLRALSDYMLSKQAIRGGQGEETQAFEEWKKKWGPYARGARERIYGQEPSD